MLIEKFEELQRRRPRAGSVVIVGIVERSARRQARAATDEVEVELQTTTHWPHLGLSIGGRPA